MTVKRVPLLKRKKRHDVNLNSLTAALYWDKIAKESLGDNDIPLAPTEGVAKTKKATPMQPSRIVKSIREGPQFIDEDRQHD